MICLQRSVAVGVSAAFLLLAIGVFARGDDAAAKPVEAAKPAKASAAPVKSKPRLSPELTALRDQVRQQLAAQQKQTFNTRQNSPTEILGVCLAFGCDSAVSLEGPDGQRINGITCLCWNYPCQGFELLGFYKNHAAARIGYGYQERPGEFLAMLAMSRVADSYPIRVNGKTRKIADLVETEKLGCRSGADLSLKLIGLTHYVAEPEWKNDLGETWSIERMIDDELAQPAAVASDGGLNRLLGISYAVASRGKTRPAARTVVPAGTEVHRPVPGVRPAAAKCRRELGAVFPCRESRQPRCARGVAIDRPRLGVAGPVAARGEAHRSPRSERRRAPPRPRWQPALPVERAVAVDSGDCLVGTRLARIGDLRPAGVRAV